MILLGILAVTGCARPAEPTPADLFPRSGEVPGWRPSGETQTYTRENLFDYMDGEAEMYFVYGFEEMRMQEYVGEEEGLVRVEIYRVDTDENAYGLFTFYRAGQFLDVGNEGDLASGGRLCFWKDRHFVCVFSVTKVEEATLQAFTQLVAGELPAGGTPPELVSRLPREKLVPRSEKFFHEKLALDNIIWTVKENVLNVSAETDAVAATYDYGGAKLRLLIVAYPEAEAAAGALRALNAASSETLSAAEQRDRYIVAVFQALDEGSANDLLQRALEQLQVASRRVTTACAAASCERERA